MNDDSNKFENFKNISNFPPRSQGTKSGGMRNVERRREPSEGGKEDWGKKDGKGRYTYIKN